MYAATKKQGTRELSNGMLRVDDISIKYRSYTIQPKLDMGSTPWLSHGNSYRTGWVVVKDGCNVLPGAGWCSSPLEAKACIDILIEANGDANKYWELMGPFRH